MKKWKVVLTMLLASLLLPGCSAHTPDGDDSEPIEAARPTTRFESEIIQFDIEHEHCRYNAIVRIKNTGDTAISLGYTAFDVEDGNGHLIATENSSAIHAQPHIVYPGEYGYYFAARLELPNTIMQDGTYKLIFQTDYIRAVDVDPQNDLQTVDISFPDGDYSKVIGRIENGSRLGTADVICICYDEQHEILTIGGTVVDLSPSGKTTFDIFNMAGFGMVNIDEYEIIARVIEEGT